MYIWKEQLGKFRIFGPCKRATFCVAEFCFLAQWWCCVDCTLYVDPEDQKHLGAEHCVAVFNHTYEIDWLVAWMMADRHAMFGVGAVRSE